MMEFILSIISFSVRVFIFSILCEFFPPEIMFIVVFGMLSWLASKAITALLALSFSGGLFTFILRLSPNQPAIMFCDESGTTFIGIFIIPVLNAKA